MTIAIRRLAFGASLTADEATSAFDAVMAGEATPAQIAALLVALRVKGESPAEVAGAARALRAAMVALPAREPGLLVDTCGTGGGTIPTFNISTAAALLAAGAGVRIAKHGNRSFTSQCGSADVLEALGVGIDVSPAVMAAALERAGIVFMFAPLMHPAMRHVGPVRRELAIPTVMNFVGPLANPAGAGRQVIGVADEARLPLLAAALMELGTEHALVVHGRGMDEISPLEPTEGVEIRGGEMRPWSLDPREFSVPECIAEDLAGGSPADNAAIIEAVLGGKGNPASSAAVVLNAAAAVYVGGLEPDMRGSVERVRDALASGAGIAALDRLRAAMPASRAG
ncbi:MAG: anthranilate phosphoribosyltransferase [Gemmatimonadaceae bacterium]|nr:anthranilate phosphoribosyltransferase [Gemmatimonadaceae bacterium]